MAKGLGGFPTSDPEATELMGEAEEDVLYYAAFPQEHWQKVWYVKRSTNVMGIFSNETAVVRLVGSVLSEQHDEWQVGKRYFSAGSLAKLTKKQEAVGAQPDLMAR